MLKTVDNELSYRRGSARRLKSVEIVSAAAQLYEKSHLATRIALSCGMKISPVFRRVVVPGFITEEFCENIN